MIIVDVFMVLGVHCYVAKEFCLFNFLQLLILNIFFFSKASERGGHPESATYSIILLLKLKIC